MLVSAILQLQLAHMCRMSQARHYTWWSEAPWCHAGVSQNAIRYILLWVSALFQTSSILKVALYFFPRNYLYQIHSVSEKGVKPHSLGQGKEHTQSSALHKLCLSCIVSSNSFCMRKRCSDDLLYTARTHSIDRYMYIKSKACKVWLLNTLITN